jgi:uncharacterized membrane protein YczE
MLARAMVQVVLATALLGVGVALLLDARLGADGYAMLIDGVSIRTGWEFVVVNTLISAVFVAAAWARGIRPGFGTIALPVVVGAMVSLLAPRLPEPEAVGWRIAEFVAAFFVVCVGVAAYLAADSGAGPTEAAALAFDPPVPFRWSYSAVQTASGLVGWWCGADLGLGTVVVVVLIGPCVARLVPILRPGSRTRPADSLVPCC